jgi:serine/threonine-protein kinase RsbW
MNNYIDNQISIKSVPENLSVVEQYIEDVCNENKISPDIFGNILITTTEAVNNAIIHGNKNNELKSVVVTYRIDEDLKRIVFTVSDEGKGFDYNNLPDPTSPENITMIGGRGVFFNQTTGRFRYFFK